MSRLRVPFGALILAQAAHSVEEYVGRLWESFPPARFLTGLIAEDPRQGFLALNVLIVVFGLWCVLWPFRRQWQSAVAFGWGWAAVELLNGMGHLAWTLWQGSYTPGVGTAPILLVLAVNLVRHLRQVHEHAKLKNF